MSKETSDDEKMNSLVVEVRILESTFNELTTRQSLLERVLLEGRAALDSLKGLGETPSGEVLTQIGGGAMLRSQPPATDKVLVTIGANVVIERPRDEAVALLEGRNREAEKSLVSVINQKNDIAYRLDANRELLQRLLAQQGQKG